MCLVSHFTTQQSGVALLLRRPRRRIFNLQYLRNLLDRYGIANKGKRRLNRCHQALLLHKHRMPQITNHSTRSRGTLPATNKKEHVPSLFFFVYIIALRCAHIQGPPHSPISMAITNSDLEKQRRRDGRLDLAPRHTLRRHRSVVCDQLPLTLSGRIV